MRAAGRADAQSSVGKIYERDRCDKMMHIKKSGTSRAKACARGCLMRVKEPRTAASRQ
jgi:hypothetical protein